MSRLTAALLLLLLARPDALVAQTKAPAPALVPGARVRIKTRDEAKPRIAIVVAHTADTLSVRLPEFSNTVAMPLDEITRLDVSLGRHRNVTRGIVVGTVAGGTVGALFGAMSYQPCTSQCLLAPESRAQSAAIGGILVGGLGFIVGSLTGLARQDDWKRVPLDGKRVAVSVRPRGLGAGLGVRLEF